MERKFHSVDGKGFVPCFSGNRDFTQSMPNNWNVVSMRNVLFVAPTAVVCMAVGNDTFVHRSPRIYVHIGLLAINSFVVKNKQRFPHVSFSSSLKITTGCGVSLFIKKCLGCKIFKEGKWQNHQVIASLWWQIVLYL